MASSILRPLWATAGAARLHHGAVLRPRPGASRMSSPQLPSSRARTPLIARAYSSHYERMRAQLDSEPENPPKPSPSQEDPPAAEKPPSSPEPPKPDSAAPRESAPAGTPPGPDSDLPSAADSRRPPLAARFSAFMDNLQDRYVSGLQAFNSLTGYASIEAITANNTRLEADLSAARAAMRAARQRYQDTSARQVSTQRDMATLLARKASWGQGDKGRFAECIEEDYRLEADVADAGRAVEEAEAKEQALTSQWVAGMSKQYYEHQVYSDRIRRASTWGTWGLMGVNVLLFLMLQFVAEPWKRGRLLNSMEEREAKLLDRMEEGLGRVREEVRGSLAAMRPEAEEKAVEAEVVPRRWAWGEALRDPWLLWEYVAGGCSALREELRLKDVLAIGIQLVILLKSF